MFELAAALFAIFGAGFVGYKVTHTDSPGNSTTHVKTLQERLQDEIYFLMADASFLDWVTHLKVGGSRGVPVEKDTFRTVVLHKAYERLGMVPQQPTGEDDFPLWNADYQQYNLMSPNGGFVYPGEDLLVNEDTTSGFDRDRPDIWEQITDFVERNIQCISTVVAGAAATVATGGVASPAAIAAGIYACRSH